jgi:hypothetical protein
LTYLKVSMPGQRVLEPDAVHQAGERVVIGHLAQAGLGSLALLDVPCHHYQGTNLADADLAQGELERHARPIRTAADDLAPLAEDLDGFGRRETAYRGLVLRAEGLGEQLRELAAGELADRVSEEPLGRCIRVLDGAAVVQENDPIRQVFEQGDGGAVAVGGRRSSRG